MSEIFNADDQPQNQSDQRLFDQLVGEGKRFKTDEDLAKAKMEADRTVEDRNRELRELRQELDEAIERRRLAEEVARTKPVTPAVTPPGTPPAPAPASHEEKPDLSVLVRQELEAAQSRQNLQRNIDTVTSRMIELYGDDAKATQVIQAKAKDLGVSVEFLQDAAARSPKGFYQLIGVDGGDASSNSTVPNPTRGDVNQSALPRDGGTGPKPNSYQWYENLRKTDPAKYFKPEVQMALMRDATKARQEGRDFYKM